MNTRSHWAFSSLRQDDGSWSMIFVTGLDGALRLRSVGIDLPMSEIYDRVTLPPPDAENADDVTAAVPPP